MRRDISVSEQMFYMITSWQQSGLSQKAYCGQHSIAYHIFHYWYKRFKDAQLPAKEQGFAALKIEAAHGVYSCCPYAELLLADGRRLVFHQPLSSDYLKALIS